MYKIERLFHCRMNRFASSSSLELEEFKAAVSQSTNDVFHKSLGGEVSQKPTLAVHLKKKKSNYFSCLSLELNQFLCQVMKTSTLTW